ncbi:hypothetical protein [Nocardia gipuzkoensis]
MSGHARGWIAVDANRLRKAVSAGDGGNDQLERLLRCWDAGTDLLSASLESVVPQHVSVPMRW